MTSTRSVPTVIVRSPSRRRWHSGPVFWDIPLDVIFAPSPRSAAAGTRGRSRQRTPDPDVVAQARSLLAEARHPILILGSGVWMGDAVEAAQELVATRGPPRHRQRHGQRGRAAQRSASGHSGPVDCLKGRRVRHRRLAPRSTSDWDTASFGDPPAQGDPPRRRRQPALRCGHRDVHAGRRSAGAASLTALADGPAAGEAWVQSDLRGTAAAALAADQGGPAERQCGSSTRRGSTESCCPAHRRRRRHR